MYFFSILFDFRKITIYNRIIIPHNISIFFLSSGMLVLNFVPQSLFFAAHKSFVIWMDNNFMAKFQKFLFILHHFFFKRTTSANSYLHIILVKNKIEKKYFAQR